MAVAASVVLAVTGCSSNPNMNLSPEQQAATPDYEYLIGCASIGMADGGHNAANIFLQLIEENIAPVEYRVFPKSKLPYERLVTGHSTEVPPLVKGYLRAGAYVCGEPSWDPDFNTADLLVLLPMSRISPRYLKHFVHA